MGIPDEVEERVDDRLVEDETIHEATADGDRLFVVTDRRVVEAEHDTVNERERWDFDTTLLSDGTVVGVETEERGQTPVNGVQVALGIGCIFLGLFIFTTNVEAILRLGFTLFLTLAGLLVIVSGFDTDSGDVTVTIRRRGGTPDDEFGFEEENEHLATAISLVVADSAPQ